MYSQVNWTISCAVFFCWLCLLFSMLQYSLWSKDYAKLKSYLKKNTGNGFAVYVTSMFLRMGCSVDTIWSICTFRSCIPYYMANLTLIWTEREHAEGIQIGSFVWSCLFGHKRDPLCKSFLNAIFQWLGLFGKEIEFRPMSSQKKPCFNIACYPAKLQHWKCSTDITGKILVIYVFCSLKNWLCQRRHVPEAPAGLTMTTQ